MSELLALARDFIEKMANPVYGYATNEDYSARFAELLRSEGFEGRLREEISTLRRPDALTSYGWLWVIGWAKSRRIPLPDDLLTELFEEWSSVFARCAIVDLATAELEYEPRGRDLSVQDFPSPFLVSIMTSATELGEEIYPTAELGRPSGRAESVLIALLQVGRPITLDAASALLRHEWRGQRQLLEYFWTLCNSLDPETREVWIRDVNPPPIEGDRLRS
ncbi:MAG: hypothetical protein ABSH52_17630 [Terriglobia bacterium]|jgi:hypothetical protein